MTNQNQKTNNSQSNAKVIGKENDDTDAKMTETVRILNECEEEIRKSDASILKHMLKAGERIIEHFYDGDLDRYCSKKPTKPISIRSLIKENGIRMSKSRLHRCITVYVESRPLTTVPGWDTMSAGHLIALKRVKDPRKRTEDAKKIIEEELSVKDYEDLQKARDGKKTTKKSPTDRIEDLLKKLEKELEKELETASSIKEMEEILIERIMNMKNHFETLRKKMLGDFSNESEAAEVSPSEDNKPTALAASF